MLQAWLWPLWFSRLHRHLAAHTTPSNPKCRIRSLCPVFHAPTLTESIAHWKLKGCFITATKNERCSHKSGLELLLPRVGMLPGQPVPGNQTGVCQGDYSWSPLILTPKSSPLKHSFTSRHRLLILIPILAWGFTSPQWVCSPTANSCSAPPLPLLSSLQVPLVSPPLILPLHHLWETLGAPQAGCCSSSWSHSEKRAQRL